MYYRPLPADGDRPSGPLRSLYRQIVLILITAMAMAGCTSVATYQLSNSVSDGIINQDDPEMVVAGMPAYLLLLDGTLQQRPEDTELLLVTARLYGAYAALLADDSTRAATLSDQALQYARKAFCTEQPELCVSGVDFPRFKKLLGKLGEDDLPYLYEYAAAWAGSIQSHSNSWTSVADLPRVQVMLERVIAIDERYDHAMAHVYLGVMNSQLPPSTCCSTSACWRKRSTRCATSSKTVRTGWPSRHRSNPFRTCHRAEQGAEPDRLCRICAVLCPSSV